MRLRHARTHLRHVRPPLAVAAAVFAGTLLAGAPLAGAAPLEHEHFHEETVEVTTTECPGLTLRIHDVVDGSFLFLPHGPDGLAYGGDHVRGTTTITNLATGKTVTIEYVFNTRDLHVTDNGDGTLTIEAISRGRAQSFGADGERLFLDAGLTGFALLIDHAGTPTDPTDDEFLEFLGISTQVGRQDTADRDFCADMAELTG